MNQKKLLSLILAALSGGAFAQSNVTISGIAAVTYSNYKIGDARAAGRAGVAATENRLDDAGSRFVIRGQEDLGGGLSAYFQIDNRVSLDTRPNQAFGNSQGIADGESFVGIKHNDLGSLGFGKYEMHYQETKGPSESYRVENVQIYGGTNLFSKIGSTAITSASRQQNTIRYDSPNWSGFSAKVLYSFNPLCNEGTLAQGANCTTTYTGNTLIPSTAIAANGTVTLTPQTTAAARGALNSNYNKGGAWNIVGRYNNGPINAYLSWFDYKAEGAGATAASLGSVSISSAGVVTVTAPGTAITNPNRGGQKSYKVGGDYTFPFGLKAGLHFDDSKIIGATSAADQSRKAWLVPVSYLTGPHGFYVTYAKAGDIKRTNNTGADQWTLAYDYLLSKRTIVGASYVRINNETAGTYSLHNAGVSTFGGSNTAAGESVRQFSLNLTHRF